MAVLVRLPFLCTLTLLITIAHSHRLSSTRATAIALFCTFFQAFDVPVYWPILVMYFFVLFTLTMRRQIQYVHKPASVVVGY